MLRMQISSFDEIESFVVPSHITSYAKQGVFRLTVGEFMARTEPNWKGFSDIHHFVIQPLPQTR